MKKQPTPFDDVNRTVSMLLSKCMEILGDNFIAMYLHGSLATGDFNPDTSDIDFLVVTETDIPESSIYRLRQMHQAFLNQIPVWGVRLEGSFVRQELLKQSTPPAEPRPNINQRDFNIVTYGYEWVLEKYVLREKSIPLSGIPASKFINPVLSNDIHGAVINLLQSDWEPLLKNDSRLHEEGYKEYTILTMCRCLYTLRMKRITSKKHAAHWVQKKFPEWKDLIDNVFKKSNDSFSDDLEKIKAFIRFTIEKSK